jgi:hypothetical protein
VAGLVVVDRAALWVDGREGDSDGAPVPRPLGRVGIVEGPSQPSPGHNFGARGVEQEPAGLDTVEAGGPTHPADNPGDVQPGHEIEQGAPSSGGLVARMEPALAGEQQAT